MQPKSWLQHEVMRLVGIHRQYTQADKKESLLQKEKVRKKREESRWKRRGVATLLLCSCILIVCCTVS